MSRRIRAQELLAAGLCVALISCTDAEIRSDLNTEGPPRVITVTVRSESAETADAHLATYCASEDQGEKVHADYCPNDGTVTDALPIGWSLRVIFNELLNADQVEELVTLDDGSVVGSLANTQPVELTCGGQDVPYDGYYQPSGNHLTIPPGPALIIQPIFPDGFVATSTQDCQVTVKSDVLGKSLEPVDPARSGPFQFGIAPLKVIDIDPAGEATGVDITANITIYFNAYIGGDSLAGNIELEFDNNGTPELVPVDAAALGEAIVISPQADLNPDTEYTIRVLTGVTDIAGGALPAPFESTFTTGAGA